VAARISFFILMLFRAVYKQQITVQTGDTDTLQYKISPLLIITCGRQDKQQSWNRFQCLHSTGCHWI